MEDIIKVFSSLSQFNFTHQSVGGIALGFLAIGGLAILSYVVFRMAILGLKLASIVTAVYFLFSFANVGLSENSPQKSTSHHLNQQSSEVSELREQVTKLLGEATNQITPFLKVIKSNS